MRIIDADSPNPDTNWITPQMFMIFQDVAKKMPTIDLLMCKDCSRKTLDENRFWCKRIGRYVDDNCFCYWGERRK